MMELRRKFWIEDLGNMRCQHRGRGWRFSSMMTRELGSRMSLLALEDGQKQFLPLFVDLVSPQ